MGYTMVLYRKIKNLRANEMKKKKFTPLQSDDEQKNMHIRILIGAIIITVIIVIFAVTS
mgnify:CR=1 FL=1